MYKIILVLATNSKSLILFKRVIMTKYLKKLIFSLLVIKMFWVIKKKTLALFFFVLINHNTFAHMTINIQYQWLENKELGLAQPIETDLKVKPKAQTDFKPSIKNMLAIPVSKSNAAALLLPSSSIPGITIQIYSPKTHKHNYQIGDNGNMQPKWSGKWS